MGRHVYSKKKNNFVKITVEIESSIYEKLKKECSDRYLNFSIKEVVNRALNDYLSK